MKTHIAATLTAFILVGCSGLLPQYYDANEYELLARLETTVAMISDNCPDSKIVQSYIPSLEYDAKLLHTYTFYIPRNTDVYDMVNILKDDVLEFKAQYDKGAGTPLYCKLKSKTFLVKVRRALEAVASKERL